MLIADLDLASVALARRRIPALTHDRSVLNPLLPVATSRP
jgi:predicted amidohydrolase